MSRNNIAVPEAKNYIDSLKEESLKELNITLHKDNFGNYANNGDITSRQAGAIGGSVVKKVIRDAEKNLMN